MQNPIIEISDGKLRGTFKKNMDGDVVCAFLGVPFAKPPIGELRFKAPQPVERWEGVKDATKYGDKPLHVEPLLSAEIQGSENCLHLNVMMKKLPDENSPPKPVLVYFYGGKFRQGSNCEEFCGTDFLLVEDFVIVLPNYRLGLLGFLSLEDSSLDVPGNAGLKDQVLALQWVQNNIQKFGGDPNNVTIMGHSTGGCTVHYHMFSPLSRGLFHKAIMLSGSIFWQWSDKHEFSLHLVLDLLNVKTKCLREILKHLQNIPAKAIVEAQEKYFNMHGQTGLIIGPVIEKPNRTAFLTEDPVNLLLNGEFTEVPILCTYTSHEALMFELIGKVAGANTKFPIKPEDIVPKALKSKMSESTLEDISSEIENVYANVDPAWRRCMMLSDLYFVAPLIAAAKTHAEVTDQPVYLMRWSIDDAMNSMKIICKADCPGTSHCDETGYLFSNTVYPRPAKGSTADKAIRRIVHFVKNFCEFGNPALCQSDIISKWQPLQVEKLKILDFGSEMKFVDFPERERMKLWERIMKFDRRETKLGFLKLV